MNVELPDSCYCYPDYQKKKHKTSTNPLINIYINRITNRFVFKIKNG